MANENILEGIRCPRCGNTERFSITCTTLADVTDDGAEAGDMEWDDDSLTVCSECGRRGKLKEFLDPAESPPDPVRERPRPRLAQHGCDPRTPGTDESNRDCTPTGEYLIRAWCARRFTTTLSVTADSPRRAIAVAREQQHELLDAVEECNRDYPWDEFAAYDENGDDLLHVLDDVARAEAAAPELLAACRMVVDRWERGDLAEAARACAAAIEKATAT